MNQQPDDHADNTNDHESENLDMSPEEHVTALRRAKKQAQINEVQRRLNEPQRQRDARLVERFGPHRIALAEKAFPSLKGEDTEDSALGDQLDASIQAAHDFVEAWLSKQSAENPKRGRVLRALLASQDYSGIDRWRRPQDDDLRTVGLVANISEQAYHREFSSTDGVRLRDQVRTDELSGFAQEHKPALSPDTGVYAIVSSWPFERTLITSSDRLAAFIAHAVGNRMCDVWTRGGGCNGMKSFQSVAIPVVRGDLIIVIMACEPCIKRYCKEYEISNGQIVNPDKPIL